MLNKRAAETRTFSHSLRHKMATDELLTGTPTVVEVGSSALTISSVGINEAERTISGFVALVSQAVEFTVAGGTAGTTYSLKITAVTDADAEQTLVELISLRVN